PVQAPYHKPLIERHLSELKARLNKAAKALPVSTRALFLNGEPVEKIVDLSSKKNAYEMIVVGTHGRKGVGRLILGSVAEEIIRNATIPVLAIGPEAKTPSPDSFEGPIKILVPTGLTPNSERAETYAVSLAKRLDAEVILFHSMHESLHPVLQTAF